MREIIISDNKLDINDIDEEVVRVKALIINSKNEILLGYFDNNYQFPGGHLEKGENTEECLIREIKEETGMIIKKEELKPFMIINHLSKNYFNSGKNRCNKMVYYVIKTDQEINLNNTNYTKEEKEGGYTLYYVPLKNIEDLLIDHSNSYPKFKAIAYEMLEVLNEYMN